MNGIDTIQSENLELLREIATLKSTINEIYNRRGPGNNDYIDLTIKLNLLVKEYVDEKIKNLI